MAEKTLTEQTIIHNIDDKGIARITLNRPEKHNAFDGDMIQSINNILEEWQGKESIKCLVINANGKNFSAGADLNWMKETLSLTYDENVIDAKKLARLMRQIYDFKTPVITLVQGLAYGGALGIVTASDIAFCTTDAKFCFSEVKIGLIPAVISPYVIKAIGEKNALRYMLSADFINAEKALDLGIVQSVVSELNDEASKFIKTLLKNSPAALKSCKSLIKSVVSQLNNPEIDNFTSQSIAQIRVSKEGQEGLHAFFEKRKPSWCGESV